MSSRRSVSWCSRWRRSSRRRPRLSKPSSTATIELGGEVIASFDDLVEAIAAPSEYRSGWAVGVDARPRVPWRLSCGALTPRKPHVGQLIRGDASIDNSAHAIDTRRTQSSLWSTSTTWHDRAQRFVVGVVLKRELKRKEGMGTSRPLMFVVLDELNKYAPREGHSPIKDVLLDIAERGRSLGVVLIGAQQTASEVAPRIVANCSIRVAGRLDGAEAKRAEYGFLTPTARARATLLKPGSMILSQPEIPVPLPLRFPYPAWATRRSEVGGDEDPFAPVRRRVPTCVTRGGRAAPRSPVFRV